jgi:hypothetical protein
MRRVDGKTLALTQPVELTRRLMSIVAQSCALGRWHPAVHLHMEQSDLFPRIRPFRRRPKVDGVKVHVF